MAGVDLGGVSVAKAAATVQAAGLAHLARFRVGDARTVAVP